MPKTFSQIGSAVGKLVQEKNAAYGSSFAKSGEFLALLWPNGVPVDRYDDALLMVRIFDKQMRVATDKDALGESPYQDIAGYGVIGVYKDQHKKESSAAWQGSANAPDATNSSKAQPVSTTTNASATTTTSENEIAASGPSQPLESSSAPSKVAIVPTVMAVANGSEGGQLRKSRNEGGRCARCEVVFIAGQVRWSGFRFDTMYIYCSKICKDADCQRLA